MEIDTVIAKLEERKREIDITIRTLRSELDGKATRSSGIAVSIGIRKRAPMSTARKKALSAKLKRIWAARKKAA